MGDQLQSLTGPSETAHKPVAESRCRSFNPSQVRLKPPGRRRSGAGWRRFNPSQVRLKRSSGAPRREGGARFNPSQVRLKHEEEQTQSNCYVGFNPSQVRLKPPPPRFRERGSRASIPHRSV